VERVSEVLKAGGSVIPAVNMVEVRPDVVRVVGLAFEEYVIRAIG
jgi:hypothetical protein